MASLLPKSGNLFNCAEVAPAPSKDYCQVLVTKDQVIFRRWPVTLRKSDKVTPGETKDTYDDFEHDDRLQSEIRRVFGTHTLEYIRLLVKGHVDYLPRLKKDLILRIVQFLELEDIGSMAQVSRQFRELCEGDDLWQRVYSENSEMPISEELQSLAEAVGWKKLFFTNKLQLQVLFQMLSSV
ncbi:hypothetical protein CAPTEDRAFT_130358 [Capitella teleta]|uniref:F-box domain-containing protein n=1 Tax=Capitella teleta TaxID=283909 RepID=R7TVS3_CAPTE|nr:hypothetical protein CAPTEDRAFT_130358 [Capitella teleta]|eukprot:ELT97998.1 hypothetical protein CAPTEDRAFT_130358 [Capitella teleta]